MLNIVCGFLFENLEPGKRGPFKKPFSFRKFEKWDPFIFQNLKSGSPLLTFRDPPSHICEIILWMAKSGNLDPGKTGFFQTHLCCGFLKNGTRAFFQIWNFHNFMFQPSRKCSYQVKPRLLMPSRKMRTAIYFLYGPEWPKVRKWTPPSCLSTWVGC